MITTTLATIALAIAPTIEFTSDSAYKKESILDFSISEKVVHDLDDDTGEQVSEERFYTLNVNCNYALGYDVYDNPDTPYVDGVKIDGAFLKDTWKVDDFDPDAKHSVLVKTVYSDDISGWLAQAKDGDFSALMANPITLLQFGYYILAGISLVLGGFGLLKSRKRRVKTADEIAGAVGVKADALLALATDQSNDMEAKALSLVTDIVTPLVNTLSKQNETLIKATVLARNGDEASTIALLDLLKNTGAEGVADISEAVKKRIQESKAAAAKAKQEAIKAMKEAVAELPAPSKPEGYDGTSI
jgi:hypothetical protein